MRKNIKLRKRTLVLTAGLTAMLLGVAGVLAEETADSSAAGMPLFAQAQGPAGFAGQAGAGTGMEFGRRGGGFMGGTATFADEPSEIVASSVENTAAELEADTENAETITMSEENSSVKITEAGTYIITGTCSSGNITVKKEVTGVVLILKDLDLTSTEGATISCNKGSEVKIIVEGTVKLTDAENPEDENSADTEVADAFDGAALKIKAGANVALTGSGTLEIDASSCKNGIKVSDADEEYDAAALTISGLTMEITAANDAVNAGYDLIIESGDITITAGDDALHADHILQIGTEEGEGPVILIEKSSEGLEGTVVNIFGGVITVNARDDGINAANSDGTYRAELAYSVNITGGTVTVNSSTDGIDSNGNVNITGGMTTITSASYGGEAGLDYDGTCYVVEECLQNNSGVSMDSGMGGMGGRQGQQGFPGMQGQSGQTEGEQGQQGFPGMQGESGQTEGEQGRQGFPGMQGGPGQTEGEQGGQGFPGQSGEQGMPQGWQGGENGRHGHPEGMQGFPGGSAPEGQQGFPGGSAPEGQQGLPAESVPEGAQDLPAESAPEGTQGYPEA